MRIDICLIRFDFAGDHVVHVYSSPAMRRLIDCITDCLRGEPVPTGYFRFSIASDSVQEIVDAEGDRICNALWEQFFLRIRA